MELLLGCGNRRDRQIHLPEASGEFGELTTLDIDPNCKPDVLHDLNETPWPFDDSQFDEVHAYEVMEHIGKQGDWRAFFDHFSEVHRILKPDGMFFATVPMWDSEWSWGDPGHTRVIAPNTLVFLNQDAYEQVGRTTMTDYRHYYKADFQVIGYNELKEGLMAFVLKARK